MSRVIDEVRSAYIGVTRPGLVAVSGGPDSVALLLAMKEVCKVPFTAVHVNHELRGEESDGDEAFVRALCDRLVVPFRSKRLPVPPGESVESTARGLRYGWFREVAAELDCGWVATGHTADDQAETVLFRIIRGTGLQGLAGIQSRTTSGPGFSPIRPLLNVRRSDVTDYLDSIAQPSRFDSSNLNMRFTRNHIRHELMPRLVSLNPNVVEALTRLADHAAEAEAAFEESVSYVAKDVLLPSSGDMLVIDRAKLIQRSHPLCRAFFRHVWKTNGWPAGDMSAAHWSRLASLTTGDYPGGVSLRVVGDVVQLRRRS